MLPEEIIKREFGKSFKGYDVAQVEEYIDTLLGLYEQLANENKELVTRCEQANEALSQSKSKVEEAERIISLKDEMTAQASAHAQSIISEAKEKAQAAMQSAENTARKLLTEVKLKADEMSVQSENNKAAADAEAERIVAEATEEAKKLIRSTRQSCAVRMEECARKITEAKAEYLSITKAAADFRAALFGMYSDNILAIESLVIPKPDFEQEIEAALTRPHTQDNNEDDGDDEGAVLAEQQLSDREEVTSDAQAAEQSAPTEESLSDEQEDAGSDTAIPEEQHRADPVVSDESVQEEHIPPEPQKFAGFDIETEHSGQVQYDSTDISSVNGRLDSIMAKKGKTETAKGLSDKLGFLK